MSATYEENAARERRAALLLEPEAEAPAAGAGSRPYVEALENLEDAAVPYCLLRDVPSELERLADLDLLIDPGQARVADAALERAGFTRKRDRRLRGKWVYVRYEAGRFYTLDVHGAFIQGGIEYMDAARALGRCERVDGVPVLGAEDRFLHLVLHNLLGKRTLQAKHRGVLRALRRQGLERAPLEDQTRAFGTEFLLAMTLDELEQTGDDPQAWKRLRSRVRRVLLHHKGNRAGAWRFAHGDRLRWRRRPVLLALLGPDGSGKTTFADTLQAMLQDSPLRAGRVYMGCWGHDLLPMRPARRLIPPQVSHTRLLLARCGAPTALTPEERQILAQSRRPIWALALAALRYGIKGALFHVALGVELSYRYVRHIASSRHPIVITDRYVYDLEFRQGRTPFAHGDSARRLFYRLFPAPDGVLYIHAPYELVAQRKPQLTREQYEEMDRVFRALLRDRKPLEIVSDAPVEALARDFLSRHWRLLIERGNQRA